MRVSEDTTAAQRERRVDGILKRIREAVADAADDDVGFVAVVTTGDGSRRGMVTNLGDDSVVQLLENALKREREEQRRGAASDSGIGSNAGPVSSGEMLQRMCVTLAKTVDQLLPDNITLVLILAEEGKGKPKRLTTTMEPDSCRQLLSDVVNEMAKRADTMPPAQGNA